MAPASPNALDIIILGGGISGLTTALALTNFAPQGQVPRIHIFEIRPEPATVGGAVNLTPNALRMLDHLGAFKYIRQNNFGKDIDYLEVFDVYSGKIAESRFDGPEGKGIGEPPFKALRITRGDSLKAVLYALREHENITLTCGKRTVKIDETPDNVTINFEDGGSATGDILMGCDGIHSITRLKHVEPERQATYTGVSNAFGFAPVDKDFKVHFECTAINFAQRGMLLTSYHSPRTDSIYVGGLMQVPDVGSRDGWKSEGADAEKTRQRLMDRFGDAQIPCIKPLIEQAQDFFLWPVYTLTKHGKWSTDRVMLLGDAAHAMPPQGESTGIVFEDTVLFSRCLARWIEKGKPSNSPKEAFQAYENLRRKRIEEAFEESKNVVSTVSDAGWLGHKIKTFIVPWYLWLSKANRQKHFFEDVTKSEIGY
ncbi:6-hydroxynicotinate 3-monooxygenase [Lecanosticta acicola]|uniref:6-hydroxynicotinate 3-monooxygenase n=1 Tax=Lecanosticta acicola TaxID=111012 RepID=A0AAI9E9R5_9PEZI|nr:6-hydroxynicotinate 3-monooxygenase [Lecanosticta acicola]